MINILKKILYIYATSIEKIIYKILRSKIKYIIKMNIVRKYYMKSGVEKGNGYSTMKEF